MRQTIFTLGRVKQLESLPPGLSQKDLRRVDAKKGKPKSGPSRSGDSKDAQSASGSRGDQPTITSWMVQPKPSGDGHCKKMIDIDPRYCSLGRKGFGSWALLCNFARTRLTMQSSAI